METKLVKTSYPGIYKRGKTYTVMYDAPTETGSRKQKSKGGFKTIAEARAYRNEKQNEIDKGLFIDSPEITVREFLERWVQQMSFTYKQSTAETYQSVCTAHLIPQFGSIKIKNLRPAHISSYLSNLHKEGLSSYTLRNIHQVLKVGLTHAISEGYITQNVMHMVQKPRIAKKEMKTYSAEQVGLLLQFAQEEDYYMLFLAEVYTGLRRGELLGLWWSDIDLEDGLVRVNRQLQRHKGNGLIFVPEPKTQKGRRPIRIPKWLCEEFKKHKAKQAESKLVLGQAYKNPQVVFATKKGRPLDPRYILRVYKRILKKAGLPDIRFHDLRHTLATILLKKKINPKVVAELLGHENISTFLDVYAHVLPDMQDEASRAIDDELRPNIKGTK